MGLEPAPSQPAAFATFLANQVPVYAKVLKESGAKVE
jgi:hypothetical protein